MEWAYKAFDEGVVREGLDNVDLTEPWALIERFADLVRESGSSDEREAAEYMVERLSSYGLEPQVYEPELYLSVPRSAALEVIEPDPTELPCKTPAFSLSTGEGGLVGDLVEIATDDVRTTGELFTAEAVVDERVAGNFVLAQGYAMPKVVRQIERAGAAAAIFVNPGHAHEGIITSIWGTPSFSDRENIPEIVVLTVSEGTGVELRRRLASGSCRLRVRTDLFRGWAACPVVVVDLPGESPDFVFIHGHYDSWHEGIGDNAVGNAALLEVARACATVRNKLYRGIRVAWWPGHSTGRYGGSTWYGDEFAMDLRDHCVAQIDVDSPGCRWATAYDEVMWMREAAEFARRVIRDTTGLEARGMRPLRAGDYSFNQVGLTGFFMLLSNIPAQIAMEKGFYPVGGCGGNSDAWHTEGDTLEVADRDNLERDIRVYVAAVLRLATAPFLPFDYREAVREIGEVAERYADSADGQFELGPLRAEAEALLADLEHLYSRAGDVAGHNGEGGGGSTREALRRLDRVQLRLARELVPVNYQAGRRFFHDPALETPAVPDLAVLRQWGALDGDDDGRRFLLAEAVRGRNRVVDALRRARECLATLPDGG